MGLTVHRAPPFAPRLLPSPGHHPTFRASHLCAVDRLSGGGCGGAKTARNGVGGPCRSPLPGAPSGDPTPITPSVEELVSPTPFVDFVEMHCGLWEIGVFGPKFSHRQTPGGVLWTTFRGDEGAHFVIFLELNFSCNSRNRRFSSKFRNFFPKK